MPETTLIAGSDTSGKLTRADLALVPTPLSTSTHQVIPHIDIVHALEEQLGGAVDLRLRASGRSENRTR